MTEGSVVACAGSSSLRSLKLDGCRFPDVESRQICALFAVRDGQNWHRAAVCNSIVRRERLRRAPQLRRGTPS